MDTAFEGASFFVVKWDYHTDSYVQESNRMTLDGCKKRIQFLRFYNTANEYHIHAELDF